MPQFLHLLLLRLAAMLETGNFLILLLNDYRHLLGLRFEVHQRLLRFLELVRDRRLHGVLPLVHLLQVGFIRCFLLLQLILDLLLSLLALIYSDFLL